MGNTLDRHDPGSSFRRATRHLARIGLSGWGLVASGLVGLSPGCVTEEPTQLLVVLSTDMQVPEELASVGIQVYGPDVDAPPVFDRTVRLDDVLADNGGWRVLSSFGSVPKGGDPDRTVTVDATAILQGEPLFTTTSITSYVPQRRMRLDVFLAQGCVTLAEQCLPEETCGLDGCVDPFVPPGALLPADEEVDGPVDARPARNGSIVGAGDTMGCAMFEGALWCWGDVLATVGSSSCEGHTPVPVAPAEGWVHISVGRRFACGLRNDGTVWCWGENEGELGLGDEVPRASPTLVRDLPPAAWVDAGFNHTCAVTVEGELWCWGLNLSSALGVTGITRSLTPMRVGTDNNWRTVSAGVDVSCALKRDGSLHCWGRNDLGAVGTGAFTAEVPEPTRVGSRTYERIDTYRSTCAIDGDGKLWCWGAGAEGQLGDGSTDHRATPGAVGDPGWRDVTTGRRQTCGIREDGSVWCWGNGDAAGEGAGNTTPTLLDASADWSDVDTGVNVTCASRTDGTVSCWGRNDTCQAGLATVGRTVTTPTTILPEG